MSQPERPQISLDQYIREIPDFPKPGIRFKDISPLLANPSAFGMAIDQLADRFRGEPLDVVAAAEARGFLFGTPLALALNLPFVPIRKPGKLPARTVSVEYQLEYGTDRLEMHSDAIKSGDRVLLFDDVLATGGTITGCRNMVEELGARVACCAFLMELTFLEGRSKLTPTEVFSLLSY